MRTVLPYFWFLGIPMGFLLSWMVWTALKEPVREGLIERGPAIRFTIIFALIFTIPPLLLGVLQLLGGYDLPNYPYAFAPNEPYAFAGWLVIVGFGVLALAWIWLGNAVAVLSTFGFPWSFLLLRLILSVLVIASVAIWTFMPPKILGWR